MPFCDDDCKELIMSNIFKQMKKYNCEEIYFKYDPKTKLKAIIAINSTKRGSMCSGGVRMRNYKSENEALWDAFNLSLAMTQKCAAIQANVGGGKAVIWGSKQDKNPKMLESFAKFMCSLGGKFRTAVDLGLNFDDGQIIKRICPLVEGQPKAYGGLGTEGDTTAIGVIKAMQLGSKYVFGEKSLKGRTIAIQGLGNVGGYMLNFLSDKGAKLKVADTNNLVIKKYKKQYPAIKVIPVDEILTTKCDILAPCAIGGILNKKTIPNLKCSIICGCANNQLANPERDIKLIEQKKILYLPDFIVNAGGIIQAIVEINKGTKQQAIANTRVIEQNVELILKQYKPNQNNPLELAQNLVNKRLT